jgi:hypothetical protein
MAGQADHGGWRHHRGLAPRAAHGAPSRALRPVRLRDRAGRLLAALWLAISCASTVWAAPDIAAPTVAITSPDDDAVVFGGIGISATASDNVGVVGVRFLFNGSNLGSEDTQPPYAIPWNTATVGNGSYTLSARARDAAGNKRTSAPILVAVSNDGSPEQIGRWTAPVAWPLVAVHMTLLPTGEVLTWDAWEHEAFARLWNPSTQAFVSVPSESGLFCAAHAQLADGRVLVVGGHPGGEDHANAGIVDTNIFDAAARSWTRMEDMRFARWYPTTLLLPDERALSISGQIVPGVWANTPEIYDPANDRWSPASIRRTSRPASTTARTCCQAASSW